MKHTAKQCAENVRKVHAGREFGGDSRATETLAARQGYCAGA